MRKWKDEHLDLIEILYDTVNGVFVILHEHASWKYGFVTYNFQVKLSCGAYRCFDAFLPTCFHFEHVFVALLALPSRYSSLFVART